MSVGIPVKIEISTGKHFNLTGESKSIFKLDRRAGLFESPFHYLIFSKLKSAIYKSSLQHDDHKKHAGINHELTYQSVHTSFTS